MPRYRRSESFPAEFLVYSQQIGLDQTGQRQVSIRLPKISEARALQRAFYDWRHALRTEHRQRAVEQNPGISQKLAEEQGLAEYAAFAMANGIEQVMVTVNPAEDGLITFKNRNQATFAVALRGGYEQLGFALGEKTPEPRVAAPVVPVPLFGGGR
jgi:hypothetical protein